MYMHKKDKKILVGLYYNKQKIQLLSKYLINLDNQPQILLNIVE